MADTKFTLSFTGGGSYEITREGRVFSVTGWRGNGRRELKQEPNQSGYPSVRLTVAKNKRVRKPVHRLVALAFLVGPHGEQDQIRHLDGNKLNNNLSNLAWGTAKENASDRARHGKTQGGPLHSARVKMGQRAIGWNAPLTPIEDAALRKARGEA